MGLRIFEFEYFWNTFRGFVLYEKLILQIFKKNVNIPKTVRVIAV